MIKKILFAFAFLILLVGAVSAIEVNHCCEKTVDGAWCQNAPLSVCDSSFRTVPASCEATSYCRMGTCIDSQEGTCLPNTPQKVCEDNGGVWSDKEEKDLPQCDLGCCLMADQASFVTQTRCNRLSAIYGLEINFRNDLTDEVSCIATATSSVKGACVYEKEYSTTCSFVTREECSKMKSETSNATFHENYLCSNEELGADCGPSKKTTCVPEKDEIYFVDTCGNLANIYDASKIDDKSYWSKVVSKDKSCGYGDSNANSATCGNCDYFVGSTCKAFTRGEDKVKPNYGDNICRDLSCKDDEGNTYQHGETWCADSKGIDDNLPGSRAFRMMCYNGEIINEPCADFRQEICIQDEVNGFKTAACRVNKWQDCYSIDNKADCENSDKRDCKWEMGAFLNTKGAGIENASGESAFVGIEGSGSSAFSGSDTNTDSSTTTTPTTTTESSTPITGAFLEGVVGALTGAKKKVEGTKDILNKYGSCLPKYPPGFNFWNDEQTTQICGFANNKCTVVYEKGLLQSEESCVKNCWCLDPLLEQRMNQVCQMIGDCGGGTNYIGVKARDSGTKVEITSINKENSTK